MPRCFRLIACALSALLLMGAAAYAASSCLPAALFPREASERPDLRLGLVEGRPVLCALSRNEPPIHRGCWTVDARTGVIVASERTWLPARSRRVAFDKAGCFDGYCVEPALVADEADGLPTYWVMSTDATRAAILYRGAVHIYDVASKRRTTFIDVRDQTAPEDTRIGNEPFEMLFVKDMLFVVGTDAGPFMGVWMFRADGTRLGRIVDPALSEPTTFNVFGGAVSLIDAEQVAIVGPGARTMLLFGPDGRQREVLKKRVSFGACSKTEINDIENSDFSGLSKRCKSLARTQFEPYTAPSPVRLAGGDFLTPLTGAAYGSLAVLDGRTLVEKRRFWLPRCKS